MPASAAPCLGEGARRLGRADDAGQRLALEVVDEPVHGAGVVHHREDESPRGRADGAPDDLVAVDDRREVRLALERRRVRLDVEQMPKTRLFSASCASRKSPARSRYASTDSARSTRIGRPPLPGVVACPFVGSSSPLIEVLLSDQSFRDLEDVPLRIAEIAPPIRAICRDLDFGDRLSPSGHDRGTGGIDVLDVESHLVPPGIVLGKARALEQLERAPVEVELDPVRPRLNRRRPIDS